MGMHMQSLQTVGLQTGGLQSRASDSEAGQPLTGFGAYRLGAYVGNLRKAVWGPFPIPLKGKNEEYQ